MWVPTRSEAVEMFARHFEARHRSGALQKAKKTARDMETIGDVAGYEVWCDVATKIEHIRNDDRVLARREHETA